jgi:hypothetical protein
MESSNSLMMTYPTAPTPDHETPSNRFQAVYSYAIVFVNYRKATSRTR